MSETTMSPTSFKQQVLRLVSELATCIQLCQDIRTNRRLGSSHDNLDRLQLALESAGESIPRTYNNTRKLVGSEMDIGDQTARTEMSQHILDLQSMIQPRLREIAQPPRVRPRHERVVPGFRQLHSEWKSIYQEISLTMLSLSRRIKSDGPEVLNPEIKTPRHAHFTPRKSDNITITYAEFDHLVEHMKNSWEEVIDGDMLVYVNAFDRSIKRFEAPSNAYIKPCLRFPPRLSRRTSWERCSPR